MGILSQSKSLLELTGPKEIKACVLTKFTGSEGLAKDFDFKLDLLSHTTDLTAQQLLDKSVTVKLSHSSEETRIFNGIISGFDAGNIDYQDTRVYRLEMHPWFIRLKHHQDCRIFQNQTVPQIFSTICKETGCNDYDTSKLKLKYHPLIYCTQYHETSYDFLRRILAEAGIYYMYIHTENEHKLTLLDSKSAISQYKKSISYSNIHHTDEHIHKWEPRRTKTSDKISANDYNFTDPGLNLLTSCGCPALEKFFYPGGYMTNEHGERIVQNHIQTERWQSKIITGASNVLNLKPGMQFKLENSTYQTIAITHEICGRPSFYQNEIICIPQETAYAPIKHKKPKIHTQTAIVVGPKNQKTYTDQYGRIKVQFHWDRYGKKDENSSCWLRVAQPCSGPNWGGQFIPRPSSEVIINFINGDVDRPIITGSVYNETNYLLASKPTISGIKTRITDDNKCGHHLLFDDTADAEKFMLHSEGQLTIDTLNNAQHTVAQNEIITTKSSHTIQIKQGKLNIKAGKLTLKVGASEAILDQSGINIKPAGKLHLLAKGAGGSKPIARVGDDHKCPKKISGIPHQGGPILQGSPVSTANNMAIARVGDKMHCRSGKDVIKQGIPAILVDRKPIAKLNSKATHGGTIVAGSPNVYVGETKNITIIPPATITPTIAKSCTLTAFTIKCSHTSRSFKLNALTNTPTRNQNYVLQVIAGAKTPDKLQITCQGTCKKDKNCPQLLITTSDKTYTQKSAELDIYTKDIKITKDFPSFVEQILIPNTKFSLYTIKPQSCIQTGAPRVEIEAFAPTEWKGNITLGGDPWKLQGDIRVKRDDQEWTLGANSQKQRPHIFAHIQSFLDKIIPKLKSMKNYVEVKFDMPQLQLSGGVKNQELAEQFKVDTKGQIDIGMNPLFGIYVNAKILNWLIAIAGEGTLGNFLVKIKERAAQGYSGKHLGAQADIDIIFSAGMTIEGNASWSKSLKQPWQAKDSISGKIPLELKGYAEGRVRVFKCFAAAGIEAGGKSEIGVNFKPGADEQGPTVDTQFYFNGLTIYWATYHEIGKLKTAQGKGSWKSQFDKIKFNLHSRNQYSLFEPVYWPDKPKLIYLNRGAL
jgi:type VI secretion system secreted protein VgrG